MPNTHRSSGLQNTLSARLSEIYKPWAPMVIAALLFGIFMLQSLDIVWTVDIGFTLRAVLIPMLLFMLLALPWILAQFGDLRRRYWPLLLLFVPLLIDFTHAIDAPLFIRSLGYSIWFLFFICFIASFCAIRDNFQLDAPLKLALWYSAVFMGLVGIMQIVLGFFDISFFNVQWWITGKLARANGFTYEPSYYSTYLVPYWILFYYMIGKDDKILTPPMLWTGYIIVGIALVLCSSRMGWLILGLALVFQLSELLLSLIKRTPLDIHRRVLLWSSVAAASVAYLALNFLPKSITSLLFRGLSISATPGNSSAGDRFSDFKEVFEVVQSHWITGTGFGNLPHYIAQIRGSEITNLAEAESNQGSNITTEIIAGYGLLGGLAYLGFYVLVIWQLWSNSRRGSHPLSRALFWSLISMLVLLQFNQNPYRIYFWVFTALSLSVAVRPDQTCEVVNSNAK